LTCAIELVYGSESTFHKRENPIRISTQALDNREKSLRHHSPSEFDLVTIKSCGCDYIPSYCSSRISVVVDVGELYLSCTLVRHLRKTGVLIGKRPLDQYAVGVWDLGATIS